MLENVVFIGGYRTYIGKENGIYRHIPAEKLGAHILEKELYGVLSFAIAAVRLRCKGTAKFSSVQ